MSLPEPTYVNQNDPLHVLTFTVKQSTRHHILEKQNYMYVLKSALTEQNLTNGKDYLFLNTFGEPCCKVWFKDSEYVSFFSLKFAEFI